MEIDDQEYKALKGAHNLLDGLMRDTKLRPYTEKLIKAKYPSVTTSEDDPRVKEMRELAGKVNKFMQDQENEKINDRLDRSFNKLRNEYNYTDEGIEKIKKIMVEESIPNPEAAAAWWEKKNPPKPQEPSIYDGSDWGWNRETEDEDLKLLWSNEDAWANKEIGKALQDFRKTGRDE